MYTSPDDARSDLFLSAAVFLFGPLVISLLLDVLPLPNFRPLYEVLNVAIPLAVTVLVPYLLIRYRKESLRSYGLGGVSWPNLGIGALLAVPLVVASMLALLLRFGGETTNPLLLTTSGGASMTLARLAHAVGRALLAVYVTVKARDAFRQDYLTVREGLRGIGRWVVLVGAGALALLAFGELVRGQGAGLAAFLLLPLGLVGSFALALRTLRGPSVSSRQVLLTPTAVLALGPFTLSLSGERLLGSLYEAALWGGVGLLVGVLTETKRGAWAAIGFGAVIAVFTIFQTI